MEIVRKETVCANVKEIKIIGGGWKKMRIKEIPRAKILDYSIIGVSFNMKDEMDGIFLQKDNKMFSFVRVNNEEK